MKGGRLKVREKRRVGLEETSNISLQRCVMALSGLLCVFVILVSVLALCVSLVFL